MAGRWAETGSPSAEAHIEATMSNESNPIDLTDLADHDFQQPLPEIVIPHARKPQVGQAREATAMANSINDESRQDQTATKETGAARTSRLEESVDSGLDSSKISVVYVPTKKFQSKIVPKLVKLVDQGCAFVEGYNCATMFGGGASDSLIADPETTAHRTENESEGLLASNQEGTPKALVAKRRFTSKQSQPDNSTLASFEENDIYQEIPKSASEQWQPRGPFYADIPGQYSLMEDTPVYHRERRYGTPPQAPRPYASKSTPSEPRSEYLRGSPPMLPSLDGTVSSLSTANQFPSPLFAGSPYDSPNSPFARTDSHSAEKNDVETDGLPTSPRGVTDLEDGTDVPKTSDGLPLQAQASTDTMSSWEKEQLVAILQNDKYRKYYSTFKNQEANQEHSSLVGLASADSVDAADYESDMVVLASVQSDQQHFNPIRQQEQIVLDPVRDNEENDQIAGTASEEVDDFFSHHQEKQDGKVHGYVYMSDESEGEGGIVENDTNEEEETDQPVELWRRPSRSTEESETQPLEKSKIPVPPSNQAPRDPSPIHGGVRGRGLRLRGKTRGKRQTTKPSGKTESMIDLTSHNEVLPTDGPTLLTVEERRVAAMEAADRLRHRAARLKEKRAASQRVAQELTQEH